MFFLNIFMISVSAADGLTNCQLRVRSLLSVKILTVQYWLLVQNDTNILISDHILIRVVCPVNRNSQGFEDEMAIEAQSVIEQNSKSSRICEDMQACTPHDKNVLSLTALQTETHMPDPVSCKKVRYREFTRILCMREYNIYKKICSLLISICKRVFDCFFCSSLSFESTARVFHIYFKN